MGCNESKLIKETNSTLINETNQNLIIKQSNNLDVKHTLGYNISDFSIKLYQKISLEQNNLVFSPASIYLALAMTAIGSNHSTLEQFKDLLNFNNSLELAKDTQQLQSMLTKQIKGVTTFIANKIYLDLPLLGKEYEQLMTNNFEAAIERVSFASNPEQVRKNINEWVQKQTNQKIKDLLAPGTIGCSTKMVLVNAIYFKAEWLYKFEDYQTKQRDFYLEQKKQKNSIKVDTMFRQGEYSYFENEQYQYAAIPYKGNEYEMEIILPKQTLVKFASTLDHQIFLQSRQYQNHTNIKLYLPKFKIEPQKSASLKQILIELGIDKAFSNDADFSMMDPSRSVQVSDVIHKAMIEVNEKGAEAAAATAVIMSECETSYSKPPVIPIMDCNKPFIYSITHKSTNTIMFLGKVENPSQN